MIKKNVDRGKDMNYIEETSKMKNIVLSNEELDKIKKIELNLLQEFIGVCSKLNLKYYVLGGTMLGTVRHHGFIPWDDDIDVALPREDYVIFCKKCQKFLPNHIFLQTRDTDPEYIAGFAKLRDSNTTFIETSIKDRNINHGIYIDVFPLDRYPDNALKQKMFSLKHHLIKLRLRKEYTLDKRVQDSFIKRLAIAVLYPFAFMCYPTVDSACNAREHLFSLAAGKKYLANYNGAWGKREIVPAEWYADGCELTFEGIKVVVPAQYEKWLTQVYGDFMTPPPIEKQVTHHFCTVIDPDKSYKEYLGEMK